MFIEQRQYGKANTILLSVKLIRNSLLYNLKIYGETAPEYMGDSPYFLFKWKHVAKATAFGERIPLAELSIL